MDRRPRATGDSNLKLARYWLAAEDREEESESKVSENRQRERLFVGDCKKRGELHSLKEGGELELGDEEMGTKFDELRVLPDD